MTLADYIADPTRTEAIEALACGTLSRVNGGRTGMLQITMHFGPGVIPEISRTALLDSATPGAVQSAMDLIRLHAQEDLFRKAGSLIKELNGTEDVECAPVRLAVCWDQTADELAIQLQSILGHESDEQEDAAWQELADWLDKGTSQICLLRGGAGTGKTTMIQRVLAWARTNNVGTELLAPTGRAARVLTERTGANARTIHSAVFQLGGVEVKDSDDPAAPDVRYVFPCRSEGPAASLIIVDEASLIGNRKQDQELLQFGSGRLLGDLLEWTARGAAGPARVLFVGDQAQLPPVGETVSTALDPRWFESHGYSVTEVELSKVHRQAADSGILSVGTSLRSQILEGRCDRLDYRGHADITAVTTEEMSSRVLRDLENSIVVSFSNSQALWHNRAIRERRWRSSDAAPRAGDRLIVIRNSSSGLMNGDLVTIYSLGAQEVRVVPMRGREPLKLAFRTVTVESDGKLIEGMMLENLLDHHERELSRDMRRALIIDFEHRVRLKRGTRAYLDALLNDPYLNALFVKYGYCITCHKSQGGEWNTVIVDFKDVGRDLSSFRWCYTATTRARRQLGTMNAPLIGPFVGLANDGRSPHQAWDEPSPPDFEVTRVGLVQHGVKIRVQAGSLSCVCIRYEGKRGRVTHVFEKGDRSLFHEYVGLVSPVVEIPAEVKSLVARLREVAPQDGQVEVVASYPFRVRLRFKWNGLEETTDLTYDRGGCFELGSVVRSSQVSDWLERASR